MQPHNRNGASERREGTHCVYCSMLIPVGQYPIQCDCPIAKMMTHTSTGVPPLGLHGPLFQHQQQQVALGHHAILQKFHEELRQQHAQHQFRSQQFQASHIPTLAIGEGAVYKSATDLEQKAKLPWPEKHLYPDKSLKKTPRQRASPAERISHLKNIGESNSRVPESNQCIQKYNSALEVNPSRLFTESPLANPRKRSPSISPCGVVRKGSTSFGKPQASCFDIEQTPVQKRTTNDGMKFPSIKLPTFSLPRPSELSPAVFRSILPTPREAHGEVGSPNLPVPEEKERETANGNRCQSLATTRGIEKVRIEKTAGSDSCPRTKPKSNSLESVDKSSFVVPKLKDICELSDASTSQGCHKNTPGNSGQVVLHSEENPPSQKQEDNRMKEVESTKPEENTPNEPASPSGIPDQLLWVLWDEEDEAGHKGYKWFQATCSLNVMNSPALPKKPELLPFLPAVSWTQSAAELKKGDTRNSRQNECWFPVILAYRDTNETEDARAQIENGHVVKLCSLEEDEIIFRRGKDPPDEDLPMATSRVQCESFKKKTRLQAKLSEDASSGIPPYSNPPPAVQAEAHQIAKERLCREQVANSDVNKVLFGCKDEEMIRRVMDADVKSLGLTVAPSTISGGGDGLFVKPGMSFKKGNWILTYWGHLHFGSVPDDIASRELDATYIGKPEYGVTARWFYTRGAQAGVDQRSGEPIYLIPHPGCAASKINDPREAPWEPKPVPKRVANVQMMWCEDQPLGSTNRVVIIAMCDIEERDYPQELFLRYGAQYDFQL